MKLSKLIEPSFQASIQKLSAQEIPLTAAFKLKGILKRGDEELAKYEEVRKAALEKLGERDAQGELVLDESGGVKLKADNLQNFVAELNALLDTQVDLGSLSVSELGGRVSLSANDLMILGDIITG